MTTTLLKFIKEFRIKEILAFLLVLILLAASALLLTLRLQKSGEVSLTNQGYLRYVACVIDIRNEKGVLTVSNDISDACWRQAEKETGIKLIRYNEKIILE